MELSFKKIYFFLIVGISIISACLQGASDIPPVAENDEGAQHMVRVLISQKDAEGGVWLLESLSPMYLRAFDVSLGRYRRYRIEQHRIEIFYKAGSFIINGKRFSNVQFELMPSEGKRLLFEGKEYEGSFIFCVHNESCLVISYLSLEKYICSVLKSESWPGWPLEVNMVFAVACRSYVVAKMLQARKKKLLYDVKNTNIHQTYQGFHTQESLKKAVAHTRGLILTHKKKPVMAMFDSCCGGIIPAHMHGVNFDHAPYLARQAACNYCKDSKLYRWKLEIDQHELENLLQCKGLNVTALSDIVISKKDKAGIVQEITICGNNKILKVSGKKLYSWLKPLKSYSYIVKKRSRKIIFSGTGYGHHLGMCQWGAHAMVSEGYRCPEILGFYYPGTQIMKLRC